MATWEYIVFYQREDLIPRIAFVELRGIVDSPERVEELINKAREESDMEPGDQDIYLTGFQLLKKIEGEEEEG